MFNFCYFLVYQEQYKRECHYSATETKVPKCNSSVNFYVICTENFDTVQQSNLFFQTQQDETYTKGTEGYKYRQTFSGKYHFRLLLCDMYIIWDFSWSQTDIFDHEKSSKITLVLVLIAYHFVILSIFSHPTHHLKRHKWFHDLVGTWKYEHDKTMKCD